MLKRIAFILMLLTSLSVSAELNPVLLSDKTSFINITPHLEYNISEGNVLDSPPIEGWGEFDEEQIKLGFTSSVQWFRFTLTNVQRFTYSYDLELGNPLIDNIVVYVLSGGKVKSVQHLGDAQPFYLRPVKHTSFIVPLSFNPNESLEIYIALSTSGTVKLPINVWQVETLLEHQSRTLLHHGVYIGILCTVLISSFILFIFSRQLKVIYDAGFITSLLMIFLTVSGLGFHYLWPESTSLQQHAIYIFTCLAIGFSSLQATQTLKSLFYGDVLIKLYYILTGLAVCLIPITLLLSHQYGLYLITAIAITICVLHLYTGWVSCREGLYDHQEFNIGLLPILFVLILICIDNFGLINLPISNLQLIQFATLAFVLITSVSTIKQFSFSYNNFSSLVNDETDKDVQLSEQMMELQFALRELEEKNQQLEKINTLDALSGIHNRRHFDKKLVSELRRSRRELTPLSLIIFDIDHFKQVNDKYGHIAGDEVIRSIALSASDALNRESDDIFRYGGEEFTVLLPNTNLDGALILAEQIRQLIEQLHISVNEQSISCSISLGVSTHSSEQAISPNEFIEQADKALYEAKQNGRNQVRQYQNEVLRGTK